MTAPHDSINSILWESWRRRSLRDFMFTLLLGELPRSMFTRLLGQLVPRCASHVHVSYTRPGWLAAGPGTSVKHDLAQHLPAEPELGLKFGPSPL